MLWSIRRVLINIIEVILAIITFFIGMRVILKFFGANSATPFVNWIYNISGQLIYPFSGIFPDLSLGGGIMFDVVALISLLAYSLLAYLIIMVISAATVDNKTTIHEHHPI
jgi:hypothetical protein